MSGRYGETIEAIFGKEIVRKSTGDGFEALLFEDGTRVIITSLQSADSLFSNLRWTGVFGNGGK